MCALFGGRVSKLAHRFLPAPLALQCELPEMHRRGTALNNVPWWERRVIVLVSMPDQQSRSVRDQGRISPHSPNDPALVSARSTVRRFLLTRSAVPDEVQISAPVLDPTEPVAITNFGAPQAPLAAPLAWLEIGGH